MKLWVIFLLFQGLNLFLVGESYSYIIINSKNYSLELIPPKEGLFLYLEKNQNTETNNLFYYISSDNTNWKNIIQSYRNTHFILYLENPETFNKYYQEIFNEKKIKGIIIGIESNLEKEKINIEKIEKYIFINQNKKEIINYYNTFSTKNICSLYLNFFYTGDIFADNFITFVGIFLIIFIIIYFFIYFKAKKNNAFLFIQDYILAVLFFYFFHTLLFYIISSRKKYYYFDGDIYSGFVFIIFNCFQFFIKLLPNIFASVQVNVFEIREHSSMLGNSKVIHLLSCVIFFIISLQNDNTELSEYLNALLYIFNLISIFCTFFSYKQLFQEKYLDAIQNEPDYINALMFKKKLLFTHFMSITLFTIVHIIVLFFMKSCLIEYRTIKFIFIFINYSDLILLLIIFLVHYPKELPPYYIEESRDPLDSAINPNVEDNNNFRNVYNFAFNQKNEEIYFKNYQKDECSNIVIIENPFNDNKLEETNFEEDEEEEEENDDEDNINDNNDNINNNNEEKDILIEKENNVINNNEKREKKDENSDKDILDLTHSKIGFINFSL